ncbi:hemolysin family protein [Coraliomargarita sp. SDUM461004]|uniref:Hemolysin family protein n=1 Tax=Thalassobacterium sedimentorum TaxID=3041258 RepID=A0ABU1AKX5_9BACT|nr:hemolysin family protein [Coraliomargarita sp. SDUM461004]MDQ8195319.1 hemolysin family protein [Coraliomargarita sp. SDUM461004]
MPLTEFIHLGITITPSDTSNVATKWDVIILIGSILLALGFSFLCSIAEAVLLSVTPSYIESLRNQQPRRAQRLRKLKLENVDRSLAAILTLNTIAHTVGAILSGAKATIVFGSAWFGLFSAIMTLMILFLSEIVPKTLGAVYWKQLVRPTALFVETLIWLLYPMVWLSEHLTQWVSGGKKAHVFSRDELISMTRIGEASGNMPKNESRILKNLFRLNTLTAQDIMTPRMVIASMPETETLAKALSTVSERPFSRIPIYQEDKDHISGFVLRDDVLMANARGQGETTLAEIRRDVLKVQDSILLTELFDIFLNERAHIAIVLDEYGGSKGLVTLEDLVETLIGMEIIDETDDVIDMRALARKRWKNRAKTMGLNTDESESGL